MWMNHWIKTKGGTLPACFASACSSEHPHPLLSRLTWGLEPRMAGTSFHYLIIYGTSAVYEETTYTGMYTDTVTYAHTDNRLGINISFMLTFCPLCLCNRWKKTDVVTNVSQHIADSHQSDKAVLNIFHSAIQHSRDNNFLPKVTDPLYSIVLKPYLDKRDNQRLLAHIK